MIIFDLSRNGGKDVLLKKNQLERRKLDLQHLKDNTMVMEIILEEILDYLDEDYIDLIVGGGP